MPSSSVVVIDAADLNADVLNAAIQTLARKPPKHLVIVGASDRATCTLSPACIKLLARATLVPKMPQFDVDSLVLVAVGLATGIVSSPASGSIASHVARALELPAMFTAGASDSSTSMPTVVFFSMRTLSKSAPSGVRVVSRLCDLTEPTSKSDGDELMQLASKLFHNSTNST